MTEKSVVDVKMTEKCVNDELHDTSMRKLTMMLKKKLEFTKKTSKNESVDDVKMTEKSVDDVKMTVKSVDDVKMTKKSVADVKMTEKCVNDELHDTSMRKLTMMLKEKLEFTKKTSKNESVDDVKMTEKSVDDVKMTVKSVDDVKMTEKCVNNELHDTSMRKLTIMLKEKLEITRQTSKNENDNKVVMLGLDAAGKTYSGDLSPSKDSALVTMKSAVFSDNIESGTKLVVMRDGDVKMAEKSVVDRLHDKTMRQLTKMLKEKLEIIKKPSKNENDNKATTRIALKAISENRMVE